MRRGIIAVSLLITLAACSKPPTLYGPAGRFDEQLHVGDVIHLGLDPIRARGGEGSLHLQKAGFLGLPQCVTPSQIQALNPLDNAGSRLKVDRRPLSLNVRPVSDVVLKADDQSDWQLVATFEAIRPGECDPGRLYIEYAGPDDLVTRKEFTVGIHFRVIA